MEGGTYEDMRAKLLRFLSGRRVKKVACPAGSTAIYNLCSAGQYNSYSNQTECLDCWAHIRMKALQCAQALYMIVRAMPIGKYGNSKGLEECKP